jgi:PKD repeat protein
MKKPVLNIFILLCSVFVFQGTDLISQTIQTEKVCGTTEYFKAMLKDAPSFSKNLQLLEEQTERHVDSYLENRSNISGQKSAGVVKTIPVVFHIIHYGGPENISKAQILSGLEVLNNGFRKQGADTVNIPAVFKPLAADTEIDFKLATLDPNGNCTDGIVRIFSPLTYGGSNNLKALSYWPSNKYLNVWVANSPISAGSGNPVAGYAQFPGGNPLTDGIVMAYDYVGTVGSVNASNGGRTITHEVGHWLNLRHIWGDDNGACTGTDFVSDTPNQANHNLGACPTWPKISCNNGPNGEMFSNFMDYTRGTCRLMFSIGQSARMDATLNSSVSGRNNLWSASNLIATGTDPGASSSLCTPVASFNDQNQIICEGTILNFKDASWNGDVASWSWSFPGGTPATSTDSIVSVTYNNAGVYDVSLTVTNATGSDTHTATGIIKVLPAVGQYGIPFSESFENITFPGTDWIVENEGGNAWEQNSLAAKTGSNSVYINSYSGNPTGSDVFITPTYNLSWSTSHNMTFEMAFAIRSSQSTDQLKVFASTTCGQLWNIRYSKSGSSLATAGLISTPFFPTANQWATQSVSISSSSYNNKPSVRFNINIDGTVGIDETLAESLELNIYPNPVKSVATVNFKLDDSHKVYIDVLDVMGRTVNKITEATLAAGEYQFELPSDLTSGLYNVRIFIDGRSTSRKVLVNK